MPGNRPTASASVRVARWLRHSTTEAPIGPTGTGAGAWARTGWPVGGCWVAVDAPELRPGKKRRGVPVAAADRPFALLTLSLALVAVVARAFPPPVSGPALMRPLARDTGTGDRGGRGRSRWRWPHASDWQRRSARWPSRRHPDRTVYLRQARDITATDTRRRGRQGDTAPDAAAGSRAAGIAQARMRCGWTAAGHLAGEQRQRFQRSLSIRNPQPGAAGSLLVYASNLYAGRRHG
jgi:hypothetical protein